MLTHRASLALLLPLALLACKANPPAGVLVVVSPATLQLPLGGQQQFVADVTGTNDPRVTWSTSATGDGTLTESGLYTAPRSNGIFAVRATSLVDPTASGVALITVGALDAGPESDAGPADGGPPDAGPSDAGNPGDGGALSFGSFQASPVAIAPGASTVLRWDAYNATHLTLQEVGGSAQSVSGSALLVSPPRSTTYLLAATDGASTITLPATVTVRPQTPGVLIEQFSADASRIGAGSGTILRWAVANATQVSISTLGPVAGSGQRTVAPARSTSYQLSASGAGGNATASVAVAVDSSQQLTPVDPGSGDILLTLDSGKGVHPISSDIYGYNSDTLASSAPGAGLLRRGGDRWTAYDWETNASNAGSDFNHENDDFLGGGSVPAGALLPALGSARSGGASVIATIPMQGWVAADADANTPVDPSAPNIARFFPCAPRKGAALSATPDLTDHLVYADEFASVVAADGSGIGRLALSLDNEPELWATNHSEVQKSPLTYGALFDRTISLASALKDTVPQLPLLGPVNYGWEGFVSLQGAPDANGRDFLDTYLQTVESESRAQGRRLLDVLDLHWYSEATAGTVRVIADDNSAPVQAARVQAPRSLWDPSYVETSWITHDSIPGQAIQLLPRMLAKIAAAFPGTRLSLSEHSHGGGDDISGAIAVADSLGIFGQQGLYAAAYWPLYANERFTYGAYLAYRNYDGLGGAFGDTSISATSSDVSKVSVYASEVGGSATKIVAVLINRSTATHTARIVLHHTLVMNSYALWQFTATSQAAGAAVVPKQVAQPSALPTLNGLSVALPPYSVSTLVISQ